MTSFRPFPDAETEASSTSLELGKWTIPGLQQLLRDAAADEDGGHRLKHLAMAFLRTPFLDESELPHPPAGTQRVRLETFDCITFIYTMYALLGAKTPDDVAPLLSEIRYTNGPAEEHLIHYAWNSLTRIRELGLAENVTATLLDPARLATRTVTLGIKGDGERFLKHERVGDPNIGERVSVDYIPAADVRGIEPALRDGDTVVFVSAWKPEEYPGIVGHAAIVHREEGDAHAYLLHSSKSKLGSQEGPRAGVILLTEWNAERRALAEDRPLCALHCYLGHHPERFAGIVVLRPRVPR